MTLQDYEIAVLLKMYDEKIVGKRNYASLQKVRSKVRWQDIASAYGIKKSFDEVTRKLVKRKLLFDAGKSMAVLYLDKLGVDFVVAYLAENTTAFADLEAKLSSKA